MPCPLAVHVQGDTPVAVHLKKPKTKVCYKNKYKKNISHACLKRNTNLRCKSLLDCGSNRFSARKKTDLHGSPNKKYNWMSEKALLEVNQPRVELNVRDEAHAQMRTRDVLREANAQLQNHMNSYDKKIKGLMSEVGSLKNEARHLSSEVHKRNELKSMELKAEAERMEQSRVPSPRLRHINCFKEPPERFPVQRRAKQTLKRMKKSASKAFLRQSTKAFTLLSDNETPASQANVVDSLSPPVRESTRIWVESQPKPTSAISDQKSIDEEIQCKQEEVQSSTAMLERKHCQLNSIFDQLNELEEEKCCLEKNMDIYRDAVVRRMQDFKQHASDNSALHCQLLAVEACGMEVRKQVAALKDIFQRLRQSSGLGSFHMNSLRKHRNLLLQKLEQFDVANRTLYRLIVVEEKILSDYCNLQDQMKIVIQKMRESDSKAATLKSCLVNKIKLAKHHEGKLDLATLRTRTAKEKNRSVKNVSEHLRRAVVAKEVEIATLRHRMHNLKETLRGLSGKKSPDVELPVTEYEEKKMLKEKCREEILRAKKAEHGLRTAQEREQELEHLISKTLLEVEEWKKKCVEVSHGEESAKKQLEALEKKFEQEEVLTVVTKATPCENELNNQIQKLRSENSEYKSQLLSLESHAITAKEKRSRADNYIASLVCERDQHKIAQVQLNSEVQQAQQQAAMANSKKKQAVCSDCDITNCYINHPPPVIKESMIKNFNYLQSLPALIKNTELRLQATYQKLIKLDQNSEKQENIILTLLNRKKASDNETDTLTQQFAMLTEENEFLQAQVLELSRLTDERKLRFIQSRDNSAKILQHTKELKRDLKQAANERNLIKQKLESVENERRRSIEFQADKSQIKENVNKTRIASLQQELQRLRSNVRALSLSKQDYDRKYQKQLNNVVHKMEKMQASTRSYKEYAGMLRSASDVSSVASGSGNFDFSRHFSEQTLN